MTITRTASLTVILVLAFNARAMSADGWGSSWSFGPVHPTGTNHIIYAKTTLVPGRLPPITSTTGPLFLWPGISNPTSDLIQTTLDAWMDNASYCGATTGQWCVEASVFGSFGQRNGPTVAIDPDDHVTIEYRLQADNNSWVQTVTSQKLHKVVSTLTSTSGLMPGGGFGFATEADANSYTIDTQYYLCTEVHLAAADPSFGATGVGAAGAQYGATGRGSGNGIAKNLRTPDGGLTWLVDLITLPAMNPMGTQTSPPAMACGAAGAGGSAGGADGSAGVGGRGMGGQGTGGTASGGAIGTPGSGGRMAGTGGNASGSTGGIRGTGGAFTTGGTGGRIVTASGGASGGGGVTGSGGALASSGGVPGSGGSSTGLGSGGIASGGTTHGTGGVGAGGVGQGSGGTVAGETGSGSSGCACSVEASGSDGSPVMGLLLAFVIALVARSRRTSSAA